MDEFNVKDVVCLPSSRGVKMTIEKINLDGSYHCVWHELNRNPLKADYLGSALEKWVSQSGSYTLGRR
jgi:uncharacterized protein YodC (DUF2158 family)